MIGSLKQELDTLLNKEMDRKTFMKHMVFAVAMLTGVSVFIRLVSSMNKETLSLGQSAPAEPARSGYGARGGYGTRLEGQS